MEELRDRFESILNGLEELDAQNDPATVMAACAGALGDLHEYVPLLGFILRSTNIRNSFEICAPLQRLCESVLEPELSPPERQTRLILSSEWTYGPEVYPKKEYLQNYVLLGLPAPESSNPLLLPLAGHELGHPLWHAHELRTTFYTEAAQSVISTTLADVDEFRRVYAAECGSLDITAEFVVNNVRLVAPAIDWLIAHAEETFCDFVGLKLFGYSYLKAFAYMASPRLSMQRVEEYPRLTSRVRNMLDAAARFDVSVPDAYAALFEDDPDPESQESMAYNLGLADRSLDGLTGRLADEAEHRLQHPLVPIPSDVEARRIFNRIRHVVPAEGAASLADILNAAWMAFEDEDLWTDIPEVRRKRDRALKELILKNIELFEIEQRQTG